MEDKKKETKREDKAPEDKRKEGEEKDREGAAEDNRAPASADNTDVTLPGVPGTLTDEAAEPTGAAVPDKAPGDGKAKTAKEIKGSAPDPSAAPKKAEDPDGSTDKGASCDKGAGDTKKEAQDASPAGQSTEEPYQPPASSEELIAAIEAILFAMGDSVEIADLAKALMRTPAEITEAAEALSKRYEDAHAGIMIQRFDDALQMSTRGERYKDLIRIAKVPKKVVLSDAVIETLSIIAYKQPITRTEIDAIRGVSSEYAINRLISYDLVKELGRKDAPGKPILFGTTEQFLRSFGVKNLSDLPSISAVRADELKSEAEEEVDKRLGV